MKNPDLTATQASPLMPPQADLLISAYPLTKTIIRDIETARGLSSTPTMSLGELKRSSIAAILKKLQAIRSQRLWVTISDHNYQPYLPLLLLMASLTRARMIGVVDFSGQGYFTSRLRIFLEQPFKLLVGSLHGILVVRRMKRYAGTLALAERVRASAVPRNPRVAYLKTNLWFGVQAGGSIGHVAGVVNGFSRIGSPVTAYTAEALPMLDAGVAVRNALGPNVSALPLEVNGYLFGGTFTTKVRECMTTNSADVIYQRNCLANCAGVTLSREFKRPLIVEYNGSEVWIATHWGTRLRFHDVALRVEEANLRHAHLIVVVSEVLRQELLARGIPEDRILFYPNCVDPEVFNPARFTPTEIERLRSDWSIPPDAIVSAFLGTFGPWHGIDLLAQAVRQLVTTSGEWLKEKRVRFLLVGDGQLMPKVRQILEGMPREVVTFTGLVPQNEAPVYLAASDILLSPHVQNPDGSRFFGSPTKLFEYMAMGKAVVASELEQIGEVLRGSWHVGRQGVPRDDHDLAGSSALLTTPGSLPELITAIEFLVADRRAREKLGAAARTRALERYTWEKHVQAILGRIRCVVNREGIV